MDNDDYDDDDNSHQDQIISELEKINSKLESKGDFTGYFWIFLIIWLLASWPGSWLDKWTDRLWYSVRYDCDFKNVIVEKRPSDCDWFRAPIGDKDCQYKKAVNAFGTEQRKQLMDQATSVEERQRYEQMPDSVTVAWEKESD
ncbi:MAG TPA: hypothetical protein VK699_10465 [Terriglobales bacterium]|jgi:hypothetical protein|nr:hypothetical protein [Terriglobales bacterium]